MYIQDTPKHPERFCCIQSVKQYNNAKDKIMCALYRRWTDIPDNRRKQVALFYSSKGEVDCDDASRQYTVTQTAKITQTLPNVI